MITSKESVHIKTVSILMYIYTEKLLLIHYDVTIFVAKIKRIT